MLVLVCHYARRPDYWVSFHDAMGRVGASAPADVRLLAETFADPLRRRSGRCPSWTTRSSG